MDSKGLMRMSHHDHGSGWFLAQLKPNGGRVAERNLSRQGFRTFLPLHEQTRRLRGRFCTRSLPLFPGYIFVALDISQGAWRAVKSTQGITRLVSFGKAPAQVPEDLVRQLMLRCNGDDTLLPGGPHRSGDTVALTKGPFTDYVATIEEVAPDRRIWVLLDIMGGRTRVALDAAGLRPERG